MDVTEHVTEFFELLSCVSVTELRFSYLPLQSRCSRAKCWLERKGCFIQVADNLGRRQTHIQKPTPGTSLVAQWLRFHTPSAGGPGLIPGQGTRSHMHAATKSSHTTTKELVSCN